MTGPRSWRANRRRDPRCIWDAIGIGSPSASLLTCCRSWNVPRTNNHWKDKLIRSVIVLQRFDIADCYGHTFAGHDVGDRLREYVRTLLVQEARHIACSPGSFVDGACFLSPFNPSTHRSFA